MSIFKRFTLASILLVTLSITSTTVAQDDPVGEQHNPINTGVASLMITPDARAGSMGDVGAATSPDVNSQFWNASKFAFIDSKAGATFNYTPWLRKLVNDIDLVSLAGYYKFGADNNQSVSASLRYFSLGSIDIYQNEQDNGYTINPYETSFDLAYARKLSNKFSMAVAGRFIYSGLQVDDESTPGKSFAADISGFYSTPIQTSNIPSILNIGFNISNIGPQISYDNGTNSQFLPTNLRLGASYIYAFDDYNTISINADINKLLVPTPPSQKEDETPEDFQDRQLAYTEISPITGIFKSFNDAPGGMKEELQEINWSLGAEYIYNKQFAVRAGYFNEHKYKGNRKYFSVGAGFKLNIFSLDAAYLVSIAQSSPLDQTLRFSLSFDMYGLKSLMK